MDVYNALVTRSASGDGHEKIDTRGIVMIGNMQRRLYMSHGWNKGIKYLNERIAKTAIKWKKGALEDYGRGEWEKLEHLLNDFAGCRIYQEDDEQEYMVDSSPEPRDQDESSRPRHHTLKRERSWDMSQGPQTDNTQRQPWASVNGAKDSASTVRSEIERKGTDSTNSFQQPFLQQNGDLIDVNMASRPGGYRPYGQASVSQHHAHSNGSVPPQPLQQVSLRASQTSQKYTHPIGDSWHALDGVYVFPDDMRNASFATGGQLLSFHGAYNPIEVMDQSWGGVHG